MPFAAVARAARGTWPPLQRTLPWLLLLLVLAAYARIQVRGFTTGYSEVDPDGYITLAKRMAAGGPLALPDTDPFRHQTHVWVENARGEVTAKFAPGYPALLALAYRVGGDHALFWVSPAMGGLALLGSWLLFRRWLGPWPAVLALLTLALHPSFHFYSGYLLTHATGMAFAAWGMYFLWSWLAQPRLASGLAAGLCLGYATTVRQTNLLLALPLLAAALCVLWERRGHWRGDVRGLFALLAGFAFFVSLQALYNRLLFGSFTTSGYALSGEQHAFSLAWFQRNAAEVITGLFNPYLPVFFALSVFGLAACGPARERLLRLLWFLPLLLVYTSYYWVTDNWSYLRFFDIVLPLCVGAAYLPLAEPGRARRAPAAAMLALLALFATLQWRDLRGAWRGKLIGHNPREIARVADDTSTRLAPDAILFARVPFSYHTGTRHQFVLYDLEAFSRGTALRHLREPRPGEREQDPRRQPERTRRLREFYEASTDETLAARKRELVAEALACGREVAFLVPADTFRGDEAALGEGFRLTRLHAWDIEWDWWGRTQKSKWGLYRVERAPSPAPDAVPPL